MRDKHVVNVTPKIGNLNNDIPNNQFDITTDNLKNWYIFRTIYGHVLDFKFYEMSNFMHPATCEFQFIMH